VRKPVLGGIVASRFVPALLSPRFCSAR